MAHTLYIDKGSQAAQAHSTRAGDRGRHRIEKMMAVVHFTAVP